jgi:hypothetical protein
MIRDKKGVVHILQIGREKHPLTGKRGIYGNEFNGREVCFMLRVLLVVVLISAFLTMNSTADTEVLVLAGNISHSEFTVLEGFNKVDGENVSYEQTKDRSLPGLDDADILWIGQGEICENAYSFNAQSEDKIKSFVNSGGIVIVVGQDSDDARPCEVGWIPEPLTGVERGGVETFTVTDAPEVDDLFTKPNQINNAHFDDTWLKPDDPYIMLASVGPGDIGVALLKHGRGFYIVTGIENENAADVAVNTPIMENLIHYAVNLMISAAVDHSGKLAMSWGKIKLVN